MTKEELRSDANALMDLEMMDTIVGGAECTSCAPGCQSCKQTCSSACGNNCQPGGKNGTTKPPTQTPEPTEPTVPPELRQIFPIP